MCSLPASCANNSSEPEENIFIKEVGEKMFPSEAGTGYGLINV
jgi:hypothetical protein